jgi:hypothetical protein
MNPAIKAIVSANLRMIHSPPSFKEEPAHFSGACWAKSSGSFKETPLRLPSQPDNLKHLGPERRAL